MLTQPLSWTSILDVHFEHLGAPSVLLFGSAVCFWSTSATLCLDMLAQSSLTAAHFMAFRWHRAGGRLQVSTQYPAAAVWTRGPLYQFCHCSDAFPLHCTTCRGRHNQNCCEQVWQNKHRQLWQTFLADSIFYMKKKKHPALLLAQAVTWLHAAAGPRLSSSSSSMGIPTAPWSFSSQCWPPSRQRLASCNSFLWFCLSLSLYPALAIHPTSSKPWPD